jgi:hypothetical protein
MNTLLQNEVEEVIEHNGFKVTNIEGATWVFRKLRAYQVKKAEIDDLRAKEVERINLWHKKETEQIDGNIAYFEGLVAEYYKELKANDPKAKISTPYGKVSSRKTSKWNYSNEEETMKYLTSNGFNNLLRVKKELDKAELKKLFKDGVNQETGEIIPGIEITEEETIQVKVVE